jgi:hypothetical protein
MGTVMLTTSESGIGELLKDHEYVGRDLSIYQPGGDQECAAGVQELPAGWLDSSASPAVAAGESTSVQPPPREMKRQGARVRSLLLMACACLALGVFCVLAQYVVPGALRLGATLETPYHLTPWGFLLITLSPALLAISGAIVGGVLFLQAHRHPDRRPLIRACLLVFAAVLVIGGFLLLFSSNLFPESTAFGVPAAENETAPYPWPLALQLVAPGVIAPGLGVFAGLLVTRQGTR